MNLVTAGPRGRRSQRGHRSRTLRYGLELPGFAYMGVSRFVGPKQLVHRLGKSALSRRVCRFGIEGKAWDVLSGSVKLLADENLSRVLIDQHVAQSKNFGVRRSVLSDSMNDRCRDYLSCRRKTLQSEQPNLQSFCRRECV